MNILPVILVLLVVLVLLIYFSGGHGMLGRGVGISVLILLVFWAIKRITKRG